MHDKNLILVPGAWSNKSIWNELQIELQKFDIALHAITLDGLDKQDKIKNISLQEHVDNVITYINSQETGSFFLVGHSYSGFVTSLAAQQAPDKINGLIFIEAFLPENQKSLLDMAGLDVKEEKKAIEKNNGLWPPPSAEELSSQPFLTDNQKDYLIKNMVGHPGKTVIDLVCMEIGALKKIPVHYIGGGLPYKINDNPYFGKINYHKVEGGHWPMLTKPSEVAAIINDIEEL